MYLENLIDEVMNDADYSVSIILSEIYCKIWCLMRDSQFGYKAYDKIRSQITEQIVLGDVYNQILNEISILSVRN